METLTLLLCLIPAPKSPTEEIAIAGVWALDWGQYCRQVCFFGETGHYDSPRFGSGPYSVRHFDDGSITVQFVENTRQYVMWFDRDGAGVGHNVWVDEDGRDRYGPEVTVKMVKRCCERLGMPKEER